MPDSRGRREFVVLPGMGKAYASCGKAKPLGGACRLNVGLPAPQEGHSVHVVREHCDRPECPTCYPVWARRRAKDVQSRFEGYEAEAAKMKWRVGKARHVVWSPPAELWDSLRSASGVRKLRSRVTKVARAAGMRAGVIVFHSHRIKKGEDGKPLVKGKDRYRRAMEQGLLIYSPHFHILGYGWLRPSNEVFDETGWLYKMLPHRQGGYVKTIEYLLGHAGLVCERKDKEGEVVQVDWYATLADEADPPRLSKMKAYTYFGETSYNQLRIASEKRIEEVVECKKCGGECVQVHVNPTTEEVEGVVMGSEEDGGVVPFLMIRRVRTYILAKRLAQMAKPGADPPDPSVVVTDPEYPGEPDGDESAHVCSHKGL